MRSRTLQGESAPLSPWSLAVMRHLLLVLLLLVPVQVNAGSPLVARVEMTEFTFRPAVVRLPARRQVKLVLANQGQIAHQFETVYLYKTLAVVVNTALRVEANGVEFVRLHNRRAQGGRDGGPSRGPMRLQRRGAARRAL